MTRISWAIAAFVLPILILLGVEAHENENTVVHLPHALTVVTPSEGLVKTISTITPISDHGFSAQERCLAQAVYFEARSEPIEGQLAVAQVVLNRVEDKRYPATVCGVVFQNENMRHRCQFSFACDGRSDQPFDRRAWELSKKVSHVAVQGLWVDMTAQSTHYHADYVSPYWSNILHQTVSYGRHIFYRYE